MSKLISKENLIKAIVNTPTNEQANTMQGYLDGIATRQLEIIDIIDSLQTVSDKEIRDKAIGDFVIAIESLMKLYGSLSLIEIKELAEQMKKE